MVFPLNFLYTDVYYGSNNKNMNFKGQGKTSAPGIKTHTSRRTQYSVQGIARCDSRESDRTVPSQTHAHILTRLQVLKDALNPTVGNQKACPLPELLSELPGQSENWCGAGREVQKWKGKIQKPV